MKQVPPPGATRLRLAARMRAAWVQPSRVIRNRSGAVAVLFAATASLVVGMGALATEGGAWYLTRRRAQTAVDSAAMAGALALTASQSHATVVAAATEVASRNHFAATTNTTVTVNNPPSAAAGALSGVAGSVEVIIRQTQRTYLARLFLGSSISVGARAVASVQSSGNVCALGLSVLSFSGSSTVSATNCTLSSNGQTTSPVPLQISGSTNVSAYSLASAGSCTGCDKVTTTLTRPYALYQPPAVNPYAGADAAAIPSFNGGSCISKPDLTNLLPYETNGHKAYCADVKVAGGETVVLTPGTYYLNDASLTINNGSVTCPTCTGGLGITFVLTGTNTTKVGSVSISGSATVVLNAPSLPAGSPYRGILFYRDEAAISQHPSTGNPDIGLAGGPSTILQGGIYGASSDIRVTGNAASTCTAVVGSIVELGGSSNTSLDVSGCGLFGTAVPTATTVRLAQ